MVGMDGMTTSVMMQGLTSAVMQPYTSTRSLLQGSQSFGVESSETIQLNTTSIKSSPMPAASTEQSVLHTVKDSSASTSTSMSTINPMNTNPANTQVPAASAVAKSTSVDKTSTDASLNLSGTTSKAMTEPGESASNQEASSATQTAYPPTTPTPTNIMSTRTPGLSWVTTNFPVKSSEIRYVGSHKK